MAEFAVPAPAPYPVRLDVDYPERQSRWKALLRLPLAIPVLLFAYVLQGGAVLAIWIVILLRGRIPRWLFDFQVSVNRWSAGALGYLVLLTDAYPPFDGQYAIRYEVEYPQRVSRWRLVIWKLITSIPHLIVLYLLWIALGVVVMIAWFAILFTGRFPRGLHTFVVGVLRWGARVQAYAISITDDFPPFSLSPEAGAGGRQTYVICSVIGLLAVGVLVGAVAAVMTVLATESQHIRNVVSYDRLLAGSLDLGEGRAHVHSGQIDLVAAVDPADDRYTFLDVRAGYRLVEFQLDIENQRGRSGDNDIPIRTRRFRLRDTRGEEREAILATVNGHEIAPYGIDAGDSAKVNILFELPDGVDPIALEYRVLNYIDYPDFGEKITYLFQ